MNIPIAIGDSHPRTAGAFESSFDEDRLLYRAAVLWNEGEDTNSIAFDLSIAFNSIIRESEIHSRIDEVKGRAALLRGGNAA